MLNRYEVVLQNAVGNTRTLYIEAGSQTRASNKALKALRKFVGPNDWRVIRALETY